MSVLLTPSDDGLRQPGPESNWNESRYLDFFDPSIGLAGWCRLGNRPNEGHAEMSACLHLPADAGLGATAVAFAKPHIDGKVDEAAGLRWRVAQPFCHAGLRFEGEMSLLADAWQLTDPKRALGGSPKAQVCIELSCEGDGLPSVLGQDQAQIGRIFLPGQAAGHYQHLVRVNGRIKVGEREWTVQALGGRDQSWGPRNWHSKRYFRWLCGQTPDGFGFMLTRGVSGDQQRRGGFIWDPCREEAERFIWIDDFSLRSDYDPERFSLKGCTVVARQGGREWTFEGQPVSHLPLRHRRNEPDGSSSVLRIVKSPTRWRVREGDGAPRDAFGITEYHDQMQGNQPIDLSE